VDDAETDDEGAVDVATTTTREALVGSALLLAAGAIATALTDDHRISPFVLVVIGAVVAGEQLWHRRRQIPGHVPATVAARDDDLHTSVMPAGKAVFIAAMFAAFVLLSALVPESSAVMLGFLAGHAVRDLVMTIRVARWQRRHAHVLAWIVRGGDVESRVLL
jgi:hypothetical protein